MGLLYHPMERVLFEPGDVLACKCITKLICFIQALTFHNQFLNYTWYWIWFYIKSYKFILNSLCLILCTYMEGLWKEIQVGVSKFFSTNGISSPAFIHRVDPVQWLHQLSLACAISCPSWDLIFQVLPSKKLLFISFGLWKLFEKWGQELIMFGLWVSFSGRDWQEWERWHKLGASMWTPQITFHSISWSYLI